MLLGEMATSRGPNKAGNSSSKFTASRREKYLAILRDTGEPATARDEVGICYGTIVEHRRKTPGFRDDEEESLRQYRATIGKEIHRRAIEGVDEPVFYLGEVAGYVRKYSDRLLIEHAKRHVPEYREKIKIDQTGTLTVGMADLGSLSEESRNDLRRILEREKVNGGEEE